MPWRHHFWFLFFCLFFLVAIETVWKAKPEHPLKAVSERRKEQQRGKSTKNQISCKKSRSVYRATAAVTPCVKHCWKHTQHSTDMNTDQASDKAWAFKCANCKYPTGSQPPQPVTNFSMLHLQQYCTNMVAQLWPSQLLSRDLHHSGFQYWTQKGAPSTTAHFLQQTGTHDGCGTLCTWNVFLLLAVSIVNFIICMANTGESSGFVVLNVFFF